MKKKLTGDPILVEMGSKLLKFRENLRHHLKQKKILSMGKFGAKYGFTRRKIETYESGQSPIPGTLLYGIWKEGYSIDALFADGTCRNIIGQSSVLDLNRKVDIIVTDVKEDFERTARDEAGKALRTKEVYPSPIQARRSKSDRRKK